MTTLQKIKEQIALMRDEVIFDSVFYKGHYWKHINTVSQLHQMLYELRRPVDDSDIVMATRFVSKKQATESIVDALEMSVVDIVKWLESSIEDDYIVSVELSHETGDGIVKNADWNNLIPIHGVKIVLRKDNSSLLNAFGIVTAYPQYSYEDVDVIYDAIDEYKASKKM